MHANPIKNIPVRRIAGGNSQTERDQLWLCIAELDAVAL